MMTKIAAGEWASQGVRVNAICPGVLRTPMWDADVARGAIDEQFYVGVVPAHRLGMPAEVGKLAVYLSSDDAAYVTGSILTIDGASDVDPGRMTLVSEKEEDVMKRSRRTWLRWSVLGAVVVALLRSPPAAAAEGGETTAATTTPPPETSQPADTGGAAGGEHGGRRQRTRAASSTSPRPATSPSSSGGSATSRRPGSSPGWTRWCSSSSPSTRT